MYGAASSFDFNRGKMDLLLFLGRSFSLCDENCMTE